MPSWALISPNGARIKNRSRLGLSNGISLSFTNNLMCLLAEKKIFSAEAATTWPGTWWLHSASVQRQAQGAHGRHRREVYSSKSEVWRPSWEGHFHKRMQTYWKQNCQISHPKMCWYWTQVYKTFYPSEIHQEDQRQVWRTSYTEKDGSQEDG